MDRYCYKTLAVWYLVATFVGDLGHPLHLLLWFSLRAALVQPSGCFGSAFGLLWFPLVPLVASWFGGSVLCHACLP
jgi:hypothetical protein